jgi:hypothetical protein
LTATALFEAGCEDRPKEKSSMNYAIDDIVEEILSSQSEDTAGVRPGLKNFLSLGRGCLKDDLVRLLSRKRIN